MRTAVIFYSFSGNTNRVAHLMVEMLKNKGEEVIPIRIRPVKEQTNFALQCKDAFLGKKPELYRTMLDLNNFDRVIFGSPVWAFKPVPAINTYMDKCSSLTGKTAICFVTYGSGAGKDKCLEKMKQQLEAKGAEVTEMLSFQQAESPKSCREKLTKVL
ncbi:flavodoxin family protein [Candidatus Omnitrophota bacterium]